MENRWADQPMSKLVCAGPTVSSFVPDQSPLMVQPATECDRPVLYRRAVAEPDQLPNMDLHHPTRPKVVIGRPRVHLDEVSVRMSTDERCAMLDQNSSTSWMKTVSPRPFRRLSRILNGRARSSDCRAADQSMDADQPVTAKRRRYPNESQQEETLPREPPLRRDCSPTGDRRERRQSSKNLN